MCLLWCFNNISFLKGVKLILRFWCYGLFYVSRLFVLFLKKQVIYIVLNLSIFISWYLRKKKTIFAAICMSWRKQSKIVWLLFLRLRSHCLFWHLWESIWESFWDRRHWHSSSWEHHNSRMLYIWTPAHQWVVPSYSFRLSKIILGLKEPWQQWVQVEAQTQCPSGSWRHLILES